MAAVTRMNGNFGPYEITGELGRGAMGVVSLAVHKSLRRECALKTIAVKFDDPLAADRFIREGQSIARLGKHPNIVQVFDAGVVDGTPYLAMEFVEGETLDARVKRVGRLVEAETIELGRKLALALDHAHRRGIVHRDVKPANVIMNTEGEPQLLDFGIAKDLAAFSGAPADGGPPSGPVTTGPRSDATPAEAAEDRTIIAGDGSSGPSIDEGIQGTPAFMAPEQADPRRGPIDARCDVYSLGATLYVLATARRPFEAATLTEMLVRVVREPPAPPAEFAAISPDLEAVILKAMEKQAGDRYQTALEFADDLSRVATGLPTRARRLGRLGSLWRRLRTHRRLLVIAASFLVVVGVASAYYRYRSQEVQALWSDIAERSARSAAREVQAHLDPAIPMLEECVSLAASGLMPVDDQEALGRHLVARFRYREKLSWLSYGDAQGRFTGAWRHPSGRIVVQRSWLDEQGGHVREEFADGERERLRWRDDWDYDPRSRPFYHAAAAARRPVWTAPYEWFGEEGLGITSAFALRDPESDATRGVFTADYQLGTLADFLARINRGTRGRAYLLGRGGELLASPERGATSPDALLAAALRSAESTIPGGVRDLPDDAPRSFTFAHEGRAYAAAVEASQAAAGLPVLVFVLVPEEDITGPVREAAVRTLWTAGCLALLATGLSVAAGVLQKRRLVRSLGRRKRPRGKAPDERTIDQTSIVEI